VLFNELLFLSPVVLDKIKALKTHRIALYDGVKRCTTMGPKTHVIANIQPVDLDALFE